MKKTILALMLAVGCGGEPAQDAGPDAEPLELRVCSCDRLCDGIVTYDVPKFEACLTDDGASALELKLYSACMADLHLTCRASHSCSCWCNPQNDLCQ